MVSAVKNRTSPEISEILLFLDGYQILKARGCHECNRFKPFFHHWHMDCGVHIQPATGCFKASRAPWAAREWQCRAIFDHISRFIAETRGRDRQKGAP
jgi:hypothetical protein